MHYIMSWDLGEATVNVADGEGAGGHGGLYLVGIWFPVLPFRADTARLFSGAVLFDRALVVDVIEDVGVVVLRPDPFDAA